MARHIGPCGKLCGSGRGPCEGHTWNCGRIMPFCGCTPSLTAAPHRHADYDGIADPYALTAGPAEVDGLHKVREKVRVR